MNAHLDSRVRPAGLDAARRPHLFGVVHLAPLPGSPAARGGGDMAAVLDTAERDARALVEGGVDGLVVENFGDAPFFAEVVPPETAAAMGVAVARVRACLPATVPVGVNVLRNDGLSALAVAVASGASFLRVNVLAGAAVTDQGLIQASTLTRCCDAARPSGSTSRSWPTST